MNRAALISQTQCNEYVFEINYESIDYSVRIFTDHKEKYTLTEVAYRDGNELECEGEEGERRAAILDYLDQHWDDLAKEC